MHVLTVKNNRDHYTHHGLHLNSKGKECMASKIARKIAEILTVNKPKPIQIQWKDELAKDPLKVITMKEPNKGISITNQESLNDVCMKKAEVKCKQIHQDVFLSTESKQQIEVNTIINGQQNNWQEQNKGQQHNASVEEIQTDFVYTNKNKEGIIREEGNTVYSRI
jgi:hypothetical protein